MKRPVGIADAVLASLYAPTKQSVLDALSDPAVGTIRVKLGKVAITPQHFAVVKRKVNSGSIRVVYQPHLKSPLTLLPQCRYDPRMRTLALGFCSAKTVAEVGLIIHEATHAVWDLESLNARTRLPAETIASLTHGIFLSVKLAASPRADLPARGELLADPVLANALLLAERVLAGDRIKYADLADLHRSLLAHPEHGLMLLPRVS
jgi:hypothetical protein